MTDTPYNYGPLEHWLDEGVSIHLSAPLPFRWVTKDGRVLFLQDMSDEHVQNCILMMQRKGLDSDPKCIELVREMEEREEFDRHVDANEAELRQMRRVNGQR